MTTAQAKFDFSPMGVSPVVNSANMPMLAPRDVMGGGAHPHEAPFGGWRHASHSGSHQGSGRQFHDGSRRI